MGSNVFSQCCNLKNEEQSCSCPMAARMELLKIDPKPTQIGKKWIKDAVEEVVNLSDHHLWQLALSRQGNSCHERTHHGAVPCNRLAAAAYDQKSNQDHHVGAFHRFSFWVFMVDPALGCEHCLHYQGSSQELDSLRILDAEILVRLKYNKTNGDEKRQYQIKVYSSCNY